MDIKISRNNFNGKPFSEYPSEPVSWNKLYINTNTDVKVPIPMIGRELDLFIVLERNQEPYWFLHSNELGIFSLQRMKEIMSEDKEYLEFLDFLSKHWKDFDGKYEDRYHD